MGEVQAGHTVQLVLELRMGRDMFCLWLESSSNVYMGLSSTLVVCSTTVCGGGKKGPEGQFIVPTVSH